MTAPAPLPGPILRLVGIDPGSRRIGLAALTWDRGTQHGDIAAAHQVDVDPDDLPTAAAEAFAWALAQGAQGLVIEHGAFYAGRPSSYAKPVVDAFLRGLVARERNFATCDRLVKMLVGLAEHHGLRVRIVARASWAHRIVPHARGIDDAMILAALPAHLDRASMDRLTSKDRRDAAGAVLWSVLPVAERAGRARDPNRAPRRILPVEWRTIDAKPRWRKAARRLRWALAHGGIETAARLTLPCPCGPHGRGRRPSWCPRALPPKRARGPLVCQGHAGAVCGAALRSLESRWCPACAALARAAAAVVARGGSKMAKRREEDERRRRQAARWRAAVVIAGVRP